jgi:hypothetical protein
LNSKRKKPQRVGRASRPVPTNLLTPLSPTRGTGLPARPHQPTHLLIPNAWDGPPGPSPPTYSPPYPKRVGRASRPVPITLSAAYPNEWDGPPGPSHNLFNATLPSPWSAVTGRARATLPASHARIACSQGTAFSLFSRRHGATVRCSLLAAVASRDAILHRGFAEVEPVRKFHFGQAEAGIAPLHRNGNNLTRNRPSSLT